MMTVLKLKYLELVIQVHVYSLALQEYFFLSVVYASNDYLVRRTLWVDLGEISSHASSDPWLVVGDFNVTLQMCERSDYMLGMPLFRKEFDFLNCIDFIGITNIQSTGTYYSWSNKKAVGFLAKKLDRALENDQWLDSFPNVVAEFSPPDFSDHSAGLIKFLPSSPQAIKLQNFQLPSEA